MKDYITWGFLLVAILAPKFGHAEESCARQLNDIAKQLREMKVALAALQEKVSQQEQVITRFGAGSVSSTPESSQELALSSSSDRGASPQRGNRFNPDIGLVADFVARFSESDEDEEGNDRLSARHVELILGHDVDPYGRLDATITISDFEEAELEEAYYSAWDLPLGLSARIGRFRPKIGLASPQHLDSLETVDEPLVVSRYLGVEGLFRSGVELSSFLPLPWESVTHQVYGGVLEGGSGDEGTMFGDNHRAPTLYARLRNSADITDALTFDLGSTFLAGSADDDTSSEVRSVGIDLLGSQHIDPMRVFKLKGEMFLQDRSAPFEEGKAFNHSPLGAYLLADLRFAERWDIGGRWDWVEPVDHGESDLRSEEQAWSIFMSFFQSEFARWRLQYQYRRPLEEQDDNLLMLQGTFAIGSHKHSIQ